MRCANIREQRAIKVFPNPASMMLNFEFPAGGEVTIRITDATGRTLSQQMVHEQGKATFNVNGYTPGIYLYQIITRHKTQTGKLLIGH